MQLTFLGTTCMVPTKDRNHSGILLKYAGEGLLFDCGEGIQRQLKIAGIKLTDVTKVFITHWHGDHVLGLPGLIQSLGAHEYSGKLEIYGPKGTKEYMENMFKAFLFDNKVEMEIFDIEKEGLILDSKKFQIESYKLDHGIPTIGYKFIEKDRRKMNLPFIKKHQIPEGPLLGKLQKGQNIEFNGKKINVNQATIIVKGKIIGYISDTRNCPGCYKIAEDADVLISESSFESSLEEKAEKNKHMTAQGAAQIASQSDVKKLILTHFSTRYKTTEDLEKEAKDIFENTICAFDFMKVKF